MDLFLSAQNRLLSLSPALLPLGALLYSFLSSWHCSVMCGPLSVVKDRRSFDRLLKARIFAYTLFGVLLGFTGRALKDSLEFQLMNVLAFLVFCAITLVFVLPELWPGLPKVSLQSGVRRILGKSLSPSLRGLLMAAIPCHLLMFFYGLAALTASPVVGGLLLFGHAVMTTPALNFAKRFSDRLSHSSRLARGVVRSVLIFLILLNLLYFGGHLLYSPDDVRNHFFYCL